MYPAGQVTAEEEACQLVNSKLTTLVDVGHDTPAHAGVVTLPTPLLSFFVMELTATIGVVVAPR